MTGRNPDRPFRTNYGPIGFPDKLRPAVRREVAIEATIAAIEGERLGKPVTETEREEVVRLVDEISGDSLLPPIIPVAEREGE